MNLLKGYLPLPILSTNPYKLLEEKASFNLAKLDFLVVIANTAGYPEPPMLKDYSNSNYYPPSDHKKVKGLPFMELATSSI